MAQQGLNLGGLFAGKKAEKPQAQGEISGVVRDVTRRLRVLEERMTTDRKNIQLNQQNVLNSGKKVTHELKTMYDEMNEIKKEITAINEQMTMIMSALKDTTKKEDVKVLEKYIELWEPLNFVTKREVDALVRRIINENKK